MNSFPRKRINKTTASQTRGRPQNQNQKRKKVNSKEDIPARSPRTKRIKRIYKNKRTTTMDQRILHRRRMTDNVREEKQRKTAIMRRLSRTQQYHQKRLISTTLDRGSLGSIARRKVLHEVRY